MATDLTQELVELALEGGFDRAAAAGCDPLGAHAERLRAWLAAGQHGQMAYMDRTADVRCDPADPGMLPDVRSVLVLVTSYAREPASVGPAPGRVARYARGRDYHNVLHKRLRKLTRLLRARGHSARASVDSMPVMERAWAERAGLGFVGKNSCLIVPGLGSHVLISAVLTSAKLDPGTPMAQRCGECRLCLDGCPTGAFVGERNLDARRCISYLTIEHRGPIERSLRPAMGDWVFGCDECQDVCPFNRTAPPADERTAPFAPHARWQSHDASALFALDEEAFARYAQGSPIKRARREGLLRNAAIVLANGRVRRSLPVLEQAASSDPSEVVREAAAWAVQVLRQSEQE